jgi:mono/diheme cytochrome c family protein
MTDPAVGPAADAAAHEAANPTAHPAADRAATAPPSLADRIRRRPLPFGLGVAIALGIGIAAATGLLGGPNVPTNPISATAESIARGRTLYLNNCASCHGADARGGGPQSGTTEVPPPALTGPSSHLEPHKDGELFRFIHDGLPGGMPSWGGKLSDNEIWDVVNFLRSLSGGGQT